jgi:hypothetical protein
VAIEKAAAEKTIRARIKRALTEMVDADGAQENALAEYVGELKAKLAELAPLDGSDTAPEEDKAKAHLIGMWCRENHQRHIATCPTSLDNYTRVDPKTGEVISKPEVVNPGPNQVLGLGAIEAPGAIGGTAVQ